MVALLTVVAAVAVSALAGWSPSVPVEMVPVHLCLVVLAIMTFRRSPEVALVLVWLSFAVQLATGVVVTFAAIVVLVVVLVTYGAARYGRLLTLWVAWASVLVSTSWTVHLVMASPWRLGRVPFPLSRITEQVDGSVAGPLLTTILCVGLLTPWTAGLVLRLRERARRSESDRAGATLARDEADRLRALAEELAQVRAGQARLARDVHDVVGHSLAVVLAQAESARYLPDDDPEAMRRTMASIATSARASLVDVRQVLSAIDGGAPSGDLPRGTLDSLIDDVRAAGTRIDETSSGAPRPMPPDLETVAYRVLQEMLTNALKHGRRDAPVHVVRDWGEHLTITVENAATAGRTTSAEQAETGETFPPGRPGLGVDGMRRRVEHVGGTFTLTRTLLGPPGSADSTGTAGDIAPAAATRTRVVATAVVPLGGPLRTTVETCPAEDRA